MLLLKNNGNRSCVLLSIGMNLRYLEQTKHNAIIPVYSVWINISYCLRNYLFSKMFPLIYWIFTHASHQGRGTQSHPIITFLELFYPFNFHKSTRTLNTEHQVPSTPLFNVNSILFGLQSENLPKFNKRTCILRIKVKLHTVNFNEIHDENDFPVIRQKQAAVDWFWCISTEQFWANNKTTHSQWL